ncbi:EAL domain-containing protein [Methylomarinum sp. Ch1-1]|uniref:EAL domain-containing protein n=1 Tax=Methylomarinum roseum TaxID=3067653 RepID=A0AAU7NWY1_9GAMM|nr:EAL domain-containing protein [Methylomarinum sp. Ch1-1]MDP4522480.1 EAL domain-containing protein [Methylomarinum sp. Ch1-1]
MRHQKAEQHKQSFIGLRWQSYLWLSLLLLCMCTAFFALNYHALMEQFHARQQAEINSLRHHIKGLFSGSSDRLIRLGGALATMNDLGETLKTNKPSQIQSTASHYASLGYELDLRRIALYSSNATLVSRWAQFGSEQLSAKIYQQAIDKVQQQERPVTLLNCQPLCLLHAFVPVLAGGKNVGVIALGQSIADFIIGFKQATGVDIALAIPADDQHRLQLSNWGAKIPALTDAAKLMPLLRHLSEHTPEPKKFDQGQIIEWHGAHYDVHSLPLNDIISGQPGFILLISDVSQRFHDIEQALRQGMLVTLGSLIAAELILFALISAPLRRLSRLTLTLPLLAEGAYDQARQYFSSQRKKARFQDEIDFLYDSAVQLSHQLEQNSLSLASKNKELAEERDFIQGLLASAQVLVVTQTKEGHIRVGNNFVSQLTGYHPGQLHGKRFVDLISDSESREEIRRKLQKLFNSGRPQMEHEHELNCQDGERRKIAWVHTPLQEEYSDGSALLSVGMDITERVKAESRMRWLANHDPLTSLVNRHRFIEDLSHTYDEVSRIGNSAALLVFDLDHFKEINDTSGHAAGDALLKMIADELRSRARKSDIVARLGGDEFAMLMPQTDRYGAETFAKQLNERLAGTPFIYDEKRYRVGASIGIAFLPEHGATVQEVIANADLAMFEAKRAGRSRARVFSYELQQSQALTENVYWKDTLLRAMENEQLFFYFQPIVAAKTGQIVYTEALLRLKMSDGRIVTPGEFLPSAERAGLNYALDCYVVKAALKILSANPDKKLSINISTAALNDSGWTEALIEAVHQQRLSPEHMIFEITETAVISDMEKAKQIVEELTSLGFRFAVDDFGAGFSSLYYLKHLSVEYVKIDQSLIKDLINDGEDKDFVRAIISMIHVYGKKVVGEGVENAAILEILTSMDVDLVQGFQIGRPAEHWPAAPTDNEDLNPKTFNHSIDRL